MSLKTSRFYQDTPVVQTAERLPKDSDGATVLARRHGHNKFWPERWSDVTRKTHVEWRKLEYTHEHRARTREYQQRKAAKNKAAG